MSEERRIRCLVSLLDRIYKSTNDVENKELIAEEYLPTVGELARELGFKLDYVKKQLKYLKELRLINTVGMNPKRYRFDSYMFWELFAEMPEDDLLKTVIEQVGESLA